MQSYAFSEELDPDMQRIERQRRMAELLRQQSQQDVGGGMAGEVYVPPSWTQGLNRLFQGYNAGALDRKADETQKANEEGFQSAIAKYLANPQDTSALEQSGSPRARALALQLKMTEAERKAAAADKQVTMLTDAEEQAMGLPTAGVYQRDATGGVNPVYKPPEAPQVLPPEVEAQKARIAQAGRALSTTQVDMKQESEEAKEVGKYFGETYRKIHDSADIAQSDIEKLNATESYMADVETGRLAPTLTDIRAIGQSLGFEIDEKALDAGVAMRSLSNKMALSLRNPSGGEGMPGALSDADRTFLVQSVPGLQQSPGGNRMIIGYMRKIAERKIEVAQMADDYRAEHGKIDEGFKRLVREHAKANPLFAGEAAPAPAAAPTTAPKRVKFDAEGNPIGS